MKLRNLSILSLALLCLFLSVGCQDDEDGGGNACGSNFDQTAMLTAYADELIVPAFNELNESTNNLLAASDAFLETTDAANLSRLRAEIQSLYLNYVDKEMLQIGPAEDVDLQSVMNPFPVNEDIVLSLLENGIENHVFGFDRGLPALEFLFFGPYEDDQLIALFENRNFNAGSRAYLSFVVGSMQESVATVTEAWNGNYRTDFIANTGTAAGSSVSQLVNALNEQWERTKRDRLGIPAGIATLGITNPETVEAPYIGNSLELLAATIQGSKRMFQIGLDDYLDFVNAQKSGTPLTTLINNQYDLGTAAVAGLPGPLSSTVDEMPDAVANAYAELVRNIVLLKTDLPSVLCVAITYVDNPSDSD